MTWGSCLAYTKVLDHEWILFQCCGLCAIGCAAIGLYLVRIYLVPFVIKLRSPAYH